MNDYSFGRKLKFDASGNVLPSVNNTLNLGSPDYRWKDIYLSGNTIDISGTRLSRHVDGSLMVHDASGNYMPGRFKDVTTTGIISSVGNISTTANLGVGTDNPTYKLHVIGDTRIQGDLTVNGTQTVVNTDIQVTDQVVITNNGTGPALVVTQSGVETIADFCDDTSGNIVMRIADGGNVGIGTSNPQAKLDVNGKMIIYTNNTGYPFYKTTSTNIIPPSSTGTINGVNITALNKRTRASYAAAKECTNTWTARTTPADNQWRSVCWAPELSLFCAVSQSGSGNRVMTSPDGIIWTSRASAADYSWSSVCWAAELSLFCAVAYSGTGNRVMTSPNGITWTLRTSAADNNWFSVCWSPDLMLFCAVSGTGSGNRVMTSPDGINWTIRTSAEDNGWRSVCWAAELGIFCAVASSGSSNRVMTSPDGIIWTARQSAINNAWYSVCWSPELSLFCAVAYTNIGNIVMTSGDGISWTQQVAASDIQWHSVCWSPELSIFCAVSSYNAGGYNVMTSINGINWVLINTTIIHDCYSVCWSPELSIFVAVSNLGTGNRIMTSMIGMPNAKSVVKALPSQITVLSNGYLGVNVTTPVRNFHGVGEFSWTPGTANANTAYFNINDTTASNGGNYDVIWRGLGSNGTAEVALNSFKIVATTYVYRIIGNKPSDNFHIDSPNGNLYINYYNNTRTTIVSGPLSKSSGTFDIDHPTQPSKRLVHSFIEGPRCDLIYRGLVTLANGKACVNIDSDCVQSPECAMTQGTFIALCQNPQYFLQNTSGFDRVIGNITGNILEITCENINSSDCISWMVIGERQDAFIKQWNRTNSDGCLITEYIPNPNELPKPEV